jgi:hypothetical protein
MADLQTFLQKLHKNLNILREREAKYGGNAPLDLLSQIDDHNTAITLTEQVLAGELSQAEWHEALKPLLVEIASRTGEAASSVTMGNIEGGIHDSTIAGGDVVGRDKVGGDKVGRDKIFVETLNINIPLPPSNVEEKTSSSDLLISSVSSHQRLLPLAGHPVLSLPNEAKPIYTGGFRVSFTLSHNKKRSHSIIVMGLQLQVLNFVAGENDSYSYVIEGDEIIGLGSTKPHEFSLSLSGKKVGRAKWILDSTSGTVAVSRSANFFDIENPQYLTLRANDDDLEAIEGTVLCQETGLYEVAFQFLYSVAGEDREIGTDSILVYFER